MDYSFYFAAPSTPLQSRSIILFGLPPKRRLECPRLVLDFYLQEIGVHNHGTHENDQRHESEMERTILLVKENLFRFLIDNTDSCSLQ